MNIRKICENKKNQKRTTIALDEQGSLWISTGSLAEKPKWRQILFNENYKGYYPSCDFTAICATGKDFVVAAMGEDGLPYVFRSMMGGVWESVNLMCGNLVMGYQRARGKILEILYETLTRQLFMLCENGELLVLPDCPKCARIRKVSEEKITGGYFSDDRDKIILMAETGKNMEVSWEEVSQLRISSDFAEQKRREGAVLADLREINMDNLEEWLSTQKKDRCILFLCDYGVRSDQAAKYARRKGYYQAYSLGGERLKLY
ncbi:MAG: rhodanese-like domain-containing protein [Lachnospiraceae bacterium]|nr:rhodanese-like domain-containing protein [Lachnospiraceae bacterium]